MKNKNKIITNIIAITAAALFLGNLTSNASFQPVVRNSCSLAVYPFDSTKNKLTGAAGNPYLNTIDNNCKNFVPPVSPNPGPYAPQPPKISDSPLAAGAEDKNVPIAKHLHTYYNDSLQDQYYYKSALDKFEITLQSDGTNSIDLNSITCISPKPESYAKDVSALYKCDGTISDPALWGGTTVSKAQKGNSFVITWHFGITDPTQLPVRWGNNGNSFKTPGGAILDLSNENNRNIPFGVNLTSKDNSGQIWSATTTSRALVADLAINKNNYKEPNWNNGCATNGVDDSNSGWCYLDPTSGFQTETVITSKPHTYYWLPIGSVASIWRKPTPPAAPSTCQNITTNLATYKDAANTISINGQTAYPINVSKITFAPDATIPPDTTITFSSSDPTGQFYSHNSVSGANTLLGTGSFTTKKGDDKFQTVYYLGNSAKDETITAKVTGLTAAQDSKTCQQPFIIPAPIPNVCKSITTNHDTYTTNTIDIKGQTGYPININKITFAPDAKIPPDATVTFTSSDPTGQFYSQTSFFGIKSTSLLDTGSFTTKAGQLYQTVYYVSNSAKDETVTVKVTGLTPAQDSQTCQEPFLIPAPIPNVCETPFTANLDPNPVFIKLNKFDFFGSSIQANTITVSGIKFSKALPSDLKLQWKSDDPLGKFYVDNNGILGFLTPYLDVTNDTTNINQKVYYIGAAGSKITVTPVSGTGYQVDPVCQATVTLPNPTPVCLNLTGIVLEQLDPATEFNTSNWVIQLGPNNVYSVVSGINPNDINLNPNTVTYSIDPNYGEFLTTWGGATGVEQFATAQQLTPEGLTKASLKTENFNKPKPSMTVAPNTKVYFVIYSDAPTQLVPFANILKIQGSNSIAPLCNNGFPFLTPPPKVCTNITPTVSGLNAAGQLEKNKIYNDIKTSLLPIDASPNSITYKIDANYGAFVDTKNLNALNQISLNIKLLAFQSTGQLSLANLQTLGANIPVSNQISTDNNASIILVTFSNVPNAEGIIPNILTIQGSNSAIAECNKAYPFYNPPQPKICNSLSVQTAGGGNFDPTKATTFNITGDYKNHPGNIQVQNNNGTITKIDGTIANPIIFATNEAANNGLQFKYTPTAYDNTKTLNINVKAINPDNANCVAQITVQPVITQKTCEELTPGQCGGGGGGSTSKPVFNKYVYDTTHIKNAGTILNINGKTPYVTYMTILNLGNNVKEATISDSSIQGPFGQIKHIITNNKTTGELTFQHMKIDLVKGNSNLTLFKTDIFRDSDAASTAKQFADYADKPTAPDANYSIYDCSSDISVKTNSPCINTGLKKPSPDAFAGAIVEAFKAGKDGPGINFKNLGTKSGYQIIIKYQMSYDYGINNDECATMKNAGKGCGEEFDNIAHFTAVKKSNGGAPYSGDSNLDKNGKAVPVKVIAICPYVLTRQGGDVFFHDLIDTGIDVSQCSEVKNCDGPCITPKPPEKPKSTNSGEGAQAAPILLKNPSHDVCRLSNQTTDASGNATLEDYNDVLKNFSSSICELRADVSKAWTKQNITDSINANVTRLSRWETNLDGTDTLTSTDLLPGNSNGVFVKKGGVLNIKGTTTVNSLNGSISGYAIGNDNALIPSNVPAAQTYIVIGGDLHIKSNIVYKDSFANYLNNKNIPSAAFIVIDGNIIIDSDVTHIDGILMAVNTDGKGDDGKITANVISAEDVDNNILNINGNMIGDVFNLFANRHYAGDPLKDEGSINVHYDERIILNTPPGINELINLQQAVVPN